MCSIISYCRADVPPEKIQESLDRTASRGPDGSRVIDTGKGLMGFRRLSIMGLTPSGMQPFELDGSYVVCTGWRFWGGSSRMDISRMPLSAMFRVRGMGVAERVSTST